MARKAKHGEEHENLERWLLTYADLITLLLAFFIVMYSMSRVDAKKFGAMAEALRSVLGGKGTALLKGASLVAKEDRGGGPLKIGDLRLLEVQIKSMASREGLEDKIKTSLDQRGLTIRISESAFFDPSSAELKPGAKEVLDFFAELLKGIGNEIRFEGHTDSLPIRTDKFPSNWELSVTRATTCVRYLIENHDFPPDRISALGYGQYRPVASNDTPEGRAQNRRVDIVVLSPEKGLDEPKAGTEDISGFQEKNSQL